MSKYDVNNFSGVNSSLVLSAGETVLWNGAPKKSAFIINKCMTMAPFALLWLAFDGFAITSAFSSFSETKWIMIPFFAFHLMPVWIWLSNVITAKKRWENTQYTVTDKRIIIQSGFIGMDYKSIYYKEITNVRLHIGVVDKLLGVGDIYFETPASLAAEGNKSRGTGVAQAFLDIEEAYEIYPRVQKIILDIQTDIEYPNAYRPAENPGYNTKYKG